MDPMPLQEWITRQGDAGDAQGVHPHVGISQAIFVRDCLHPVLVHSYEDRKATPVYAIGEHRSKSVALPVYQIVDTARDREVIARCNFYDWKFSVQARPALQGDPWPPSLFKRGEQINSVYCEGFEDDWVFGSYSLDHGQFTVELAASLYNADFGKGMAFAFCLALGDA